MCACIYKYFVVVCNVCMYVCMYVRIVIMTNNNNSSNNNNNNNNNNRMHVFRYV